MHLEIISMQIDPDKIRTVIGPGGKTINRIINETGVKIDINDEGLIYIAAPDMEAADKGVKAIRLLNLKTLKQDKFMKG